MSLANGGFEIAGTNAYDAASWTVTVSAATATKFAVWDTGITGFAVTGAETFVGWGSFSTAFAGFFTDLSYAFFDLPADLSEYEDFEDLWGSGPATTAVADDGTDDGPYALANGMTLFIAVNGVIQTITFSSANFMDIADARPEEVANAINLTLTGAEAVLDGGAVRLQTLATGPSQSIQVTGGTAAVFLPFTATVYYGSVVGGPFIPTMEFSNARFGADLVEFENFEALWPTGSGDFGLDPEDSIRTFVLNDADTFSTGWGSYDLSLGGGVTYTLATFTGTGTTDTFEGTWTLATTI